ncbi:MAG: toll/interleukin-1 receptor domain-containing protein [Gammaproteobacteria bacterium]|nr:toll/interleukin-1 receptor domain-containing protein [Gammaproteobacteria bacterium]
MNKDTWDVFISHASEDKEDFVRPLAEALANFGAKVWYDELTLKIGDSLSRSIDKGLSQSAFGIIVISPHFLEKQWPEYELRGLVAREMEGGKVILPVWHNVTKSQVLEYSPPLADKKAVNTTESSAEKIAIDLLEIIRPDIFTRILKRLTYLEIIKNAKTEMIDPKQISMGPIRHEELPDDLVGRIRLLRAALWGAHSHSMEFWLDGFKRDSHPSREVAWWEHVAACYTEMSKLTPLTRDQHEQAFKVIFALCSGESEDEVKSELQQLPEDAQEKVLKIYRYRLPVYDVEEQFPEKAEEMLDEVLERLEGSDIEYFEKI